MNKTEQFCVCKQINNYILISDKQHNTLTGINFDYYCINIKKLKSDSYITK